ncbi:MAG TPA: hypothetical protein VL263_06855 [Vicinamibacterales bacterium]|nr:hypothetical protein [Vicinamibacterales bacterium]
MRHFAHAFVAIALAALVAPIVVATPAFGQVAMPDASQMSGIPLPAGDLPVGTISVRIFRERVGNNISGQSVSLTVSGKTKTATTDAQGRAEFPGFKPGDVAVATTTVDGEILASQEITVPSRGGTRVALVAGAKAAAAKAQAAAEAAAKEPARQGVVVIGGDSRIIFEFQSDVLTVFYILEILNNARTPIDTGAPLDFQLPSGAAQPSLMEGSSRQATVRGETVRVTGPFAPGVTSLQIGFSLPDHGASHTLRQRFPAAIERPFVAVEKIGDMQLRSAQLQNIETFNADGGKVFLVGTGSRLAAGTELAIEVSNMPAHNMTPRWIAVGLAALILAAGLYVALTPSAKSPRAALEDERARLMRELVAMEERRRAGKPKPKDAERRPAVMAELERLLAALDDEAPGGGQGAAA